MKKILFFLLCLFPTIIMACKSDIFIVYYLPIEANFYVPPTREYIMKHGFKFEINSSVIERLFKNLSSDNEVEVKNEDYNNLRILIIRKKDDIELFITADKQVLSKDKKYNINRIIIEDALNEIVNFVKKTESGK